MARLISKSKYMIGLQCLKYLWLTFNAPEKVPQPDASTQRIFDQGHQVGEIAKKLFPGGLDVPHEDFKNNINLTQKLLYQRKTLFEPGLMVDGLFCRLDILNPVGQEAWDIIEVKSSTSIKDENLHDISFQRYCCLKAGLKINRCFLAVINNQYVRQGEINPFELFSVQDVTDQVDQYVEGIAGRIEKMRETIALTACPEVKIGEYCDEPYDCPVTLCREGLPENNIFNLYRGGKKCYQLYYNGILKTSDIPEDFPLNRSQQIQKSCDISRMPHIDKPAIREFLEKIKSPVYFLDFETISPAIPLFDGMRPYQRLPFQYSLHKVDGQVTIQNSFLAEGSEDPRPDLLRNLRNVIGKQGSIITYNQSFEEGCLREMSLAFPEYEDWVNQTCSRMLDLLKPFQSFHYYHPDQQGSASIKCVLPAITGKGYDGLAISNGDAASGAYFTMMYGEATEAERQQIRIDLKEYCGLDTQGMIWILERLKEIALE